MNINGMEYLVRTIEAGSISAAAKELYITPQGLSQALQQLEREIGEKLFFRQGNHLQFTAAGEAVYNSFKVILTEYEEMNGKINAIKGNGIRQETIFLIATPATSCTFLPKVISAYQKRNPSVFLKIIERQPEEYFEGIEYDKHTVGFCAIPDNLRPSFELSIPENVSFTASKKCLMCASVPAKSPLAKKASVTARDLEKGRLALFGGDIRFMRDLPGGFDESSVAIESRNINLCRIIQSENDRVYGLTNDITDRYLKNPKLTSVPFEPAIYISYGYCADHEEVSPAVRELIEAFEKEILSE